jgi:methionyl-tRNA formyltransferase
MKSLRVVFMGTPEFAVASLGSLLINGYDVVTVVTAPDKQAGRGRILSKSAVKQFSESSYLPLLQPENLKDPDFIQNLISLKADVFVVVAFRINLHASLLPQYRGPAPINHVIINGETTTGLTTFMIDRKIDTGNILLREEIPIFQFENAGDLHDRLMKHGARLVIRTLEEIAEDTIKPQNQSCFMHPGEIIKTAPKIFPDFCIINWNKDPIRIHNLIRGLAPHPCAKSALKNEKKNYSFKIYESQPECEEHIYRPGEILSDGKSFLKIACKGGYVKILSLQVEGKNRLTVKEFLRGFKISDFKYCIS